MAAGTVAIIAAVAAVASAGVSAYGQQQQADNAKKIAEYNAAIQRQQTEINAALAGRQNEINQRALDLQRQQSEVISQQASQIEQTANEQQKRARIEQQRMLAAQRAAYAKAGVMTEGSPIAVLAETAGIFELQNQDVAYEADLRSRALQRESDLTKFGLQSDQYVLDLQSKAAEAARKIGIDESKLTQLQGRAAAEGYKTQSYATLLSGVSQAASVGMTYSGGTGAAKTAGTKTTGITSGATNTAR
jgi:hypothetical protein